MLLRNVFDHSETWLILYLSYLKFITLKYFVAQFTNSFYIFSCQNYLHIPSSPNSGSDCSTDNDGATCSGNTAHVSNTSSNSSAICRICQDADKTENLKTLCQCTGSIAKYHVSCLEKWLSISKTDVCELCHQHFTTKRKPRPFSEVCSEQKQVGLKFLLFHKNRYACVRTMMSPWRHHWLYLTMSHPLDPPRIKFKHCLLNNTFMYSRAFNV